MDVKAPRALLRGARATPAEQFPSALFVTAPGKRIPGPSSPGAASTAWRMGSRLEYISAIGRMPLRKDKDWGSLSGPGG